ncbi:hypothetical protein QFZ58_000702 [Streptomyces sp. B1I3]|nr:hypothetical protein [Streptomyces sp. B1I3]
MSLHLKPLRLSADNCKAALSRRSAVGAVGTLTAIHHGRNVRGAGNKGVLVAGPRYPASS